MMEQTELTEQNYHTPEMNMKYVGHSQFIDFMGTIGRMGCECMGLAKAKGEWQEPSTTSLMVGSYVDAYFTESLEAFKKEHPDIISSRGKTAGELKSDYKQADVMIQRAEKEPLFTRYLEGDKQVVMAGEISGVPVKIKIDSVDGRRITDLKTVKSISESFWAADLDQRLNVAEYWGWDIEAAMYCEIYRQNTGDELPFYLACISKDKSGTVPHPRLAIVNIPQTKISEQLENVKSHIEKIQMIKDGVVEPMPCGRCDWCADNLPLKQVIGLDELLLNI